MNGNAFIFSGISVKLYPNTCYTLALELEKTESQTQAENQELTGDVKVHSKSLPAQTK